MASALRRIYARVDRAVAASGAACRACGRCCRFDRVDHKLYVSAGELALLISKPPGRHARTTGCPYQVGRLCKARERRPLGCRTFFCEKQLADFSHGLYEEWHAGIRRVHEKRRVPYLYVELLAGLRQCRQNGPKYSS